MPRGISAWRALLAVTGALYLVAADPVSASERTAGGSDDGALRAVFRELLYRMPTDEEFEDLRSAIASGQSLPSVVESLRESPERQRVLRHRDAEARDLLTSTAPLALLFILAYVVAVRKHPERRLLYAVFVFLFTPFALHVGYVYQKVHFGDFPSFYYGAHYLFNLGRSPYGTVLADEVERRIFPFFHPPFSAFIFYPWSRLPYDTALMVTTIGNQIGVGVLLYFLLIKDRRDERVLSVCLLLYVMSFYPVAMTLDYGQINIWTTVFLCASIHACVYGKSSALAGLSLACAVLLKLYPGTLLAYLLLKRQWKAMAWCAAGVGAALVVAGVTIPWRIWESWWQNVGSRGGYGGAGPVGIFSPAGPWNQGLNGLMMRVFTDSQFSVALVHAPSLGRILTYGLALAVLSAGGGLLWWRNRRGLDDERELEIGLVLVMTALIVPLSWIHHAVMLLPAIAASARRLWSDPRPWIGALFVASAGILAWDWSWLPYERVLLLRGGLSMLLGSARVCGLVGLLVVILALLWRSLREADLRRVKAPAPAKSIPLAAAIR